MHVTTQTTDYPNNTREKTIDGNPDTFWEVYYELSDQYHPYLEYTFETNVTIQRIVYGNRKNSNQGFPNTFGIYVSETDAGEDFRLVGYAADVATNRNYIEIELNADVTCRRLRFEFVVADAKRPSCREMMFYKRDDAVALMEGLFSDYAHLQVNEKYASAQDIEQLRETVKNSVRYESSYKALLDRAIAIREGKIAYDADFEFSTVPDAKNRIEQNGDMVDYGRKKLLFSNYVTNRQVTGIAAYAGDTITVYVEAQEGAKLPSVQFSQAYGHWTVWLDGTKPLYPGVTTFVVPNLKNANYTTRYVPAAGSLYIVNPFTPQQQPGGVRIYIEGGFPKNRYNYMIFFCWRAILTVPGATWKTCIAIMQTRRESRT